MEASQAILGVSATESCMVQVAEACRRRKGAVRVTQGYLVLVDGTPGLICGECRALVASRMRADADLNPKSGKKD
jgi:hypothetical protein